MRLRLLSTLVVFFDLLYLGAACNMSNIDPYSPAKTIVKFSFLGAQDKSIASLVFCTDDKKVTIEKLKTLKLSYPNDEYELQHVIVSEDELKSVFQAAMSFKSSAEADNAIPELAVVILNTESDVATHYKLGLGQAKSLYGRVGLALKQDAPASEKLKQWGLRTRLSSQ